MESKKNIKLEIIKWLIRFLKGTVIGVGAILPGVSGGVLAAIFNVYERMIAFLADIRRDFLKNVYYFTPIGVGGLVGIYFLSSAVAYLLETGQAQVIWFFIGCVAGTLPLLFQQAGREGRANRHYVYLAISTAVTLALLFIIDKLSSGAAMPQNIGTWLMSGVIVGLGAIVPGLSPSNFLIYMQLYKPMVDGISNRQPDVIIPLIIGCVLCLVLFSKVIKYLLDRMYTTVFHIILGIIIASSIKIIPIIDYLTIDGLLCAVTFIGGASLGYFMSILERKYKN